MHKLITVFIFLSFFSLQGCSLIRKESITSLSPCGTESLFDKPIKHSIAAEHDSLELSQHSTHVFPNTDDDVFKSQFSAQHPYFFDDKDILLQAVKTKPEMLRYASSRLKKDREVV